MISVMGTGSQGVNGGRSLQRSEVIQRGGNTKALEKGSGTTLQW